MDSIGRLNTVKLAAIPGVIGWSMIAMANNVPLLIIGRLLTGLASGTACTKIQKRFWSKLSIYSVWN